MIDIVNEHPKLRVNRRDLAQLVNHAAKGEKRSIGTISILLVTDRKITKVHNDYLDDPTPTDVITFDLSNVEELSGDLVISLDTAIKQAAEYGVTLKQEVGRLAIHGLLHLCGMSDKTPALRQKMHIRENKHLKAAGWINS
jgi:probable rRNA maturation factor